MPIVQTFFGCTDLLTGGVILGWIAAILRGIFLGLILLGMLMVSSVGEFLKTMANNDNGEHGLTSEDRREMNEFSDLFSTHVVLTFGVLALFIAAGLAIAIVFIIGCQKKRSSYLIPYLVYDILSLIMWFFNWIGSVADAKSFFFTGAIFGVMIYLYIVAIAVYQHVKELERQPPPQAYLMQPMVQNHIGFEAPPPAYPNLYPTKEKEMV